MQFYFLLLLPRLLTLSFLCSKGFSHLSKNYKKQNELRFGIFSRPDALLLTVSDTGVGISNKNKEHIFDNGFSTKGDGRGTGLYQVKEMIDAIGGKITVESQENVGTSFTVSISKEV